jgi:hypothetical protein
LDDVGTLVVAADTTSHLQESPNLTNHSGKQLVELIVFANAH